MRFLIDAQLPPALARWLVVNGVRAEHVNDCGMQSASDAAIWSYAESCSAIIVTKDEDFAQRKAMSDDGPPVVWIRVPNVRRQEMLKWFATALPAIVAALRSGETLIEIT